jgi:hypothetical protein
MSASSVPKKGYNDEIGTLQLLLEYLETNKHFERIYISGRLVERILE